MKNDTLSYSQPKESRCSHIYVIQNRLQGKKCNKRQRQELYNDKGGNSSRRLRVINIYTPNTGTPKYTKQFVADLKWEIDSNTIIGDLNSPITAMNKSSRKKVNKERADLNQTLNEMDLIDL